MSELVEEIAKVSKIGPCVNHEFEAEEYTQEAGANVPCESKIPFEEDQEDTPDPASFETVYVNFMMLHPQEQNEIIAQLMATRYAEVEGAKKEVERLENLYYKNLNDKL